MSSAVMMVFAENEAVVIPAGYAASSPPTGARPSSTPAASSRCSRGELSRPPKLPLSDSRSVSPHRREHLLAKEIDDFRLIRRGNVDGYVRRSNVGEVTKRPDMVLRTFAYLPVLVDRLEVYLRLATSLDVRRADVVEETVLPRPGRKAPFLGGVMSLGIASHDRP